MFVKVIHINHNILLFRKNNQIYEYFDKIQT